MLKTIKKYELADGITSDVLVNNGFTMFSKNQDGQEVMYYNTWAPLHKDVEVFIDIIINPDGTLSFDDYENVLVIDDAYGQPYTPFYDNKPFQFLSIVIMKYNEVMDKLVTSGVLKEKEPTLEDGVMKKVLEKKDEKTI